MIWRIFFQWERISWFSTLCAQCSVEITGIRYHAFGKNFVKATVLLNKLLKSWFDEIFFGEREFLLFPQCVVHYTVWKLWNFTATIFLQKFRESIFLLKNFTRKLIWRKEFAWQWISRFSTLWHYIHSTVWKM